MAENIPADASTSWSVTRIANACVLLQVGDAIILTDPWFRKHWAFTEHATVKVEELPHLTALIGCHFVWDHWEVKALAPYPHKDSTPVYCATDSMAKRVRKVGFTRVERLQWGDHRKLTESVSLEVIEDHVSLGNTTSNYAITSPNARIFFGGETLRPEPISRYARENDPFDAVIGPVNGVHIMGKQLVAMAAEMVEVTRILRSSILVPIHYAHRNLGPLGAPRSSVRDLDTIEHSDMRIVELSPGERFAG